MMQAYNVGKKYMYLRNKISSLVILAVVAMLLVPNIVFAASSPAPASPPFGFEDQLGGKTIPQLVSRILTWVLPLTGSLLLFMFLYGGVLWFTAGGNADRVKKATQTMVNAAIGMAIIVFSYALVFNLVTKLGNALSGGS